MKIKAFFKNVGQGDTIMLEWLEDVKTDIPRYAMIDCNLVDNNIGVVVNHIKLKGIKQFEFVLLSHPHTDHFSGLPLFLQYCKEQNIIVKNFIHTASFDPTYLSEIFQQQIDKVRYKEVLTLSVNSKRSKSQLFTLYKDLSRHHKDPKSFIERVKIINNDSVIPLTRDVKMKFWAPESYDEMRHYFKKTFKATGQTQMAIRNELANNPHANMLSSFIQIYSDENNWQILLCADLTKFTLRKMLKSNFLVKELTSRKLIAAQIPHHGSVLNHYEQFWKKIPNLENAHTIISVGLGFGHPAKDVISFFKKNSLQVHATNFVGGYQEFFSPSVHRNNLLLQNTINMTALGVNLQQLSSLSTAIPKCGEKCLTVISDENGVKYDVEDIL